MADFVESAKNFVSSAVSRTSWEAQKQLRVRNKQSEIGQLMEQRDQLLDEMANIAITLYQQGRLQDAQLSRLCASVIELDQDTKNREFQLQEIKNEVYTPSQFGPTPTTNYAPPPPAPPSGGPSQNQAGPGAYQAPFGANAPGSGPAMGSHMATCPTCGNPVRPNALYCRSCGTKLR